MVVLYRNFLFDKGILKSETFNFPLICIGNLVLGGTGKTPMVELLVHMLKDDFEIATLSRGYKRKTTGFAIANEHTTAIEIGDEPMQFHLKFPDITVAVGEERLVAIPQILHQRPKTDVIILDDAFQHRAVKAGINILLTEYTNLYVTDRMFPVGYLRDVPESAKRADIVIVTKCPPTLNNPDSVKSKLKLLPHQQVYFTALEYDQPYHLFNHELFPLNKQYDVLLISGIANPSELNKYLKTNSKSVSQLQYPDHHIFETKDLDQIRKNFEHIKSEQKLIITTEKDAVRLYKYEKELGDFPIYVLPVRHQILYNQESEFKQRIIAFIKRYPTTGKVLGTAF